MGFWSKLLGGSPKENVGTVSSSLRSFNYNVVGEANYQDALKGIAGGYARESQYIDCEAVIWLEPENRYDNNAVKVTIDNQTVGYIPASDALRVGNLLRSNGLSGARVEASIRGGWKTNQHDKGFFGVKLKLPKTNSGLRIII